MLLCNIKVVEDNIMYNRVTLPTVHSQLGEKKGRVYSEIL